MKWWSGASASRRGTHGAKESAAANVPLFYPGSRIAGKAGREIGLRVLSYRTGCVCVREAVRGGSSAGREQCGAGRRVLDYFFFSPFFCPNETEPEPGSCLRLRLQEGASQVGSSQAAPPLPVPFKWTIKRVAPIDASRL